MLVKQMMSFVFVIMLSACATNAKQNDYEAPALAVSAKQYRDKTTDFFADLHGWGRHIEDQSYNFLYRARDEFDRFIYDARKEYDGNNGFY